MSDTRAAIRELRSLSEKRSTQGLTEQEQGRLAELRERLGLPSEPAEGRPAGRQPEGTVAPSAPVTASPAVPPTAAPGAPVVAASPRLDGTGASPLPRLELAASPVVPPELGAPSSPEEATLEVEALPELEPAEPVPALEVEMAPDATTDPAIELRAFDEARAAEAALEPLDLAAAEPPAELVSEPAADLVAAEPAPQPVLDPLEMAAEPLDLAAAESPAEPVLGAPEMAAEPLDLAAAEPAAQPVLEPLEMAAEPLDLAAAEPPAEPVLGALEMAAVESTEPVLEPAADLAAEELPPEDLAAAPSAPDLADTGAAPMTQPLPRRLTLAERIAAAEASEASAAIEPPVPAEAPGPETLDGGASEGWGAVQVGPEPTVLQELGTPLDGPDPAELGFGGDAAPIELSSADVILLENESAPETELSGQPEDPVPLAALHEFIGAQPEDPRALALDDAGEQPTFAPEELQASEAELAAEPQAFQPAPVEALPELPDLPVEDQEPPAPPPAPAAPRIVVPRPPPAPPRPAAAAPGPERAAPPAVATPRPPPPPAAAYVMGEDGRRLPALSAARPEPPHLAHQFGGSGPFVRNKPVLLTQANLDVMAEADADALPHPMPPPPPTTDVATGAEVFGGAYLNPTFVEGEHRVVLHTLEGQVRRGMVKDLDLLDPVIRLAQPGRPPEAIPAERVKAIFFMLEPGTPTLPSTGRRIRVGFADGRQIVGFSEDVDAGEQGFFLVPADTRTHTARIYVFRAGIASISAA